MKVLVFGRTGQVGQALARDARVVAVDRQTADLTQPDSLQRTIHHHAPDVVINAAAYTAVDQAEKDPDCAFQINATAPGLMAQICTNRAIPFVHISSDYVFDGTGHRAWRPTDHVAPRNLYGASKAAGERAVRAALGRSLILRTSWVFSDHGQNFVTTMRKLGQTHSQLSVVADQIGGPTPAANIASSLLVLAHHLYRGHPGGTYHYAGAPWVSWAAFARAIFAASGQGVQVRDIPTSAYPTPAIRPHNSRLCMETLTREFGLHAPDWRAALYNMAQAA